MRIHDAVCISLYNCRLAGVPSAPPPPSKACGPSLHGPQTAGKQQGETRLACYFVLKCIEF